MSARGLLPLFLGGGLAYWAYTKKDEAPSEDDSLDLPSLEDLLESKAKAAEATVKEEGEALKRGGQAEVDRLRSERDE
jgi:hypothetical protein